MRKVDIFSGKYCWWVLGLFAFFWAINLILPSSLNGILWMVFFLILGAACLWNYRNCGRIHCKITGIGFLGVATLILLTTAGILPLTDTYLSIAIIFVIVVGYGWEFWYKSKTGSCYK